jgi:hypothetical protein
MLLRPLVLQTEIEGEESIQCTPRNCVVEVITREEWQHDVGESDIAEGIDILDRIDKGLA